MTNDIVRSVRLQRAYDKLSKVRAVSKRDNLVLFAIMLFFAVLSTWYIMVLTNASKSELTAFYKQHDGETIGQAIWRYQDEQDVKLQELDRKVIDYQVRQRLEQRLEELEQRIRFLEGLTND